MSPMRNRLWTLSIAELVPKATDSKKYVKLISLSPRFKLLDFKAVFRKAESSIEPRKALVDNDTMQYITTQCNVMQYSTVPYNSIE